MNANQIIPVIAKIAPPLALGTLVFLALKEIFSADHTETKPEITPANAGTENHGKSPVVSAVATLIPAISVPPVPRISAPIFVPFFVPITQSIGQTPPLPHKRNIITREDMAGVFQHGTSRLTRKEAVEILNSFGFGQTAAYEALLEDGRFSDWLQFAQDGIITWTG